MAAAPLLNCGTARHPSAVGPPTTLLPHPISGGTRRAARLTSFTDPRVPSMHEQPSTSPVPQLFVNCAPAPGLTSSLNTMVVHVVEAPATAEVGVVSPLRPPMPPVGVEATRLAIDLPFGGRAFSGKLTHQLRGQEPAIRSTMRPAASSSRDPRDQQPGSTEREQSSPGARSIVDGQQVHAWSAGRTFSPR